MGWPKTTEDYKHIEQVCSWPSPTLRDWICYWKDQIKWYEDFTEERRQDLEAQLNRDRPEFGGSGKFKFADKLAYYRQIVRIGQNELARRRSVHGEQVLPLRRRLGSWFGCLRGCFHHTSTC